MSNQNSFRRNQHLNTLSNVVANNTNNKLDTLNTNVTNLENKIGVDTSDSPLSLTALTRVHKDVTDQKLGSIQTFLDKDSGVNFHNKRIEDKLDDAFAHHATNATKLTNIQTITDTKLTAIQNFLDKDNAQFHLKHHTTSNLIGNELSDGTGAVRHATIDSNGRVKVVDQYSSTLSGYLESIRNNTNILRLQQAVTTNSVGASLSGTLGAGVSTTSCDLQSHKHIHFLIDGLGSSGTVLIEGSHDNSTYHSVSEVSSTPFGANHKLLHKITNATYRYYRIKNDTLSAVTFTHINFTKLNL